MVLGSQMAGTRKRRFLDRPLLTQNTTDTFPLRHVCIMLRSRAEELKVAGLGSKQVARTSHKYRADGVDVAPEMERN